MYAWGPETGFFYQKLGCTDRLGKKPGFFVGVRPGLYLSAAKARQALMSAEFSSEKSSRISVSVMPLARYAKMWYNGFH
jgi:hypothetical protein